MSTEILSEMIKKLYRWTVLTAAHNVNVLLLNCTLENGLNGKF